MAFKVVFDESCDTVTVLGGEGKSVFREIDGHDSMSDPTGEHFERANMFAAAPDMLDALKIVLQSASLKDTTLSPFVRETIEAAIAKATGGQ